MTLFFLVITSGMLYADDNVSFDKFNFMAQESEQSEMELNQTVSTEPQEENQQQAPVMSAQAVAGESTQVSANPSGNPPTTLEPIEVQGQGNSVGASYKPWQLRTQLRSGVASYSNFFYTQHDPKGEIVFENGPTFLFSNKSSPFHLNVDYQPTYRSYYRHTGNDSLDQSLQGFYYSHFGKFYDRGSELLTYSSQSPSEEINSGSKIFLSIYSNEFGYNLNKAFSLALLYQNEAENYLSKGYTNSSYVENTFGPRIYYHLRPKLDFFIQSEYSYYSYDQDASRNSDQINSSVGIRGVLDQKTTFQIQGGYQTSSQSGGQNSSAFTATGIIEHHFTPKTQLLLTAEKGTQQSVYTNGSYGYWLVSSELEYRYSPKTSISLLTSLQNISYTTASAETSTNMLISTSRIPQEYIDSESLNLNYRLNKKIALRASLSYQNKLSNIEEFQYQNYLFELSLIYDL